jgi:hypothetical protein
VHHRPQACAASASTFSATTLLDTAFAAYTDGVSTAALVGTLSMVGTAVLATFALWGRRRGRLCGPEQG